MLRAFVRRSLLGAAIVVTAEVWAVAQAPAPAQAPALTKEQMRTFLETAKVTRSRSTGKGVTRPFRLTLTDGTITHDALFQSVDERAAMKKFDRGRQELNFVDSYHYNIAAYDLAEMLGLDMMMPMSVERRWNGRAGSLTWWVDDVMMDEGERLKKQVRPPNPDAWNKQFYRMRIFSQLVYDTDRNLTNVLITKDWHVWMIDFTRAFRLWPDLPSPGDLTRCDRQVLERLRQIDQATLEAKLKDHLSAAEIAAVLTRRDKIVERFAQLTAERGEAAVLF
jgi:hypothetical protein